MAVSTPSPGITNSEVPVAPSYTLKVFGTNVIALIAVPLHGLVTSIVRSTSAGVNEVEDYPALVMVIVLVRLTAKEPS